MDDNLLSKIMVPEGLQVRPTMTTCTIEGSLEAEDLRQLIMTPNDVVVDEEDPRDLKKIREKHHHVARQIAAGLSQRLVSQITGYTEQYLSILLNSPAMVELVELYRIQNGQAAQLAHEKLKTVGLKALELLDEKLDNNELNNLELLSAAKLGLDRSGHGPSSTQKHVGEQHVFDHAKLAELNLEARRRNADYIVPQDSVRESLKLPAPTKQEDAA
jgi:hypothetical protein